MSVLQLACMLQMHLRGGLMLQPVMTLEEWNRVAAAPKTAHVQSQ